MRKYRFLLTMAFLASFLIVSCEQTAPETETKDPIEDTSGDTEKPNDNNDDQENQGKEEVTPGDGEGNKDEQENEEDKGDEENKEEQGEDTGHSSLVAPNANTYILDGIEYSFASTAVMELLGNPTLAASPIEGYTDVINIMSAPNKFFCSIAPEFIGKQIDLMTDTQAIKSLQCSLGDKEIPANVSLTSYINKGTCLVTYSEGSYTVQAGMRFNDGVVLAVNFTASTEGGNQGNQGGNKDEAEISSDKMFSYEDEVTGILGADYIPDGETATIMFHLANDKELALTMPIEYFFDEAEHSFTDNENISLDYEGVVMSAANGNDCYVLAIVDLEAETLDIEFTNFDNCEFAYIGNITIY